MSCDTCYRVWADVDLGAIRSNIEKIHNGLKPGTKVCAVVKADAYGHGAVPVSQSIGDLVDFYAVATMEEAIELREAGIEHPILILGFVHPSYADVAAQQDVRLTVFDTAYAKELSERIANTGRTLNVHIKIDTGMSRIGFAPVSETIEKIKEIGSLPGIRIEGMFTHFAQADDAELSDAARQYDRFREFVAELEHERISIPVLHCSNSAAATKFQEANMDMVRLGVSMYGMYPSQYVHDIPLSPALSLKSHVIMVKEIPAGTKVGYGGTWTAPKNSLIATIPVGYADGFHRLLSNKGSVLIAGHKYPIVGRVCMDQLMADVSDSIQYGAVKNGDEATLIGTDQEERISAEEVADLAGTINYEITCSLSPRVPRKYCNA